MGDGRAADLLVLGDCNPDVLVLGGDVTPEFGQQEKLVDRMDLTVGGSASITAVAAARLGLRVALVAAVGDDPAGHFMLGRLAAEGVDVSAVAVRDSVPTGMTVALSRGEDRAILTATGAMASVTAADVPRELLRTARHVHVSSYFLLERTLGPGLAALFAAARAAGAGTSLDTNWDPAGRWGGTALRAVLGQTSLLVPNEAEALRLARRDSLPDAVGTLTAAGTTLVVKQGARGALCAAPGQSETVHVQLPPVRPVDTTGAGDCFNAGLIAGLLRGLPLPRAAAVGCAVAAASTQAPGGTGSPLHLDEALSRARAATIGQVPSGPD
ncbi:MAG TPA: sugar kinase [Streptosporangiaceae bacterium]|jgi:sugar/nucleoside kinase (ribokinase family)